METPEIESLYIEGITVPDNRRAIDKEAVKVLAASISKIGLRTPITIRSNADDMAILVAGAHRLAAAKSLGWKKIDCIVLDCDETQAELWEIAENLHRAELTVIERAEQIARWVELSNMLLSQVATKATGGRPESGERRAARELGIDKDSVNRAVKISKITAEAKEAAAKAGLSNNQSALLAAAHEVPERQADAIREYADNRATLRVLRREIPEANDDVEQVCRSKLFRAWIDSTPATQQWFLDTVIYPKMNKRTA